jgi:hypothetical protein
MSMLLCYVDTRGKFRETVIACDGGVFKLCRDEEERTFTTLHELLINHKPDLKRGLRFSKDLYNNRKPIQCITFPFSRSVCDVDTKEAATRRAKITVEMKRTMQALILQSVSNPQDNIRVESKSFHDLVLSIDSILSDGLMKNHEEKQQQQQQDIKIQGGYASFLNSTSDTKQDELDWIVRSLSKRSVSTDIRNLIKSSEETKKYYRKDALVRTKDEISNLLTLLEGLITIRFDEDSLNNLTSSSKKNATLEYLESMLERFVVRFVQSDPQPDCLCVCEDSNLKDLILALDQVLSHGLIENFERTISKEKEEESLLRGGYYAFLNGQETSTPSDDDGEIGRIQRWICRAIETGTLADRVREAVANGDEDVKLFYKKNALIAIKTNRHRILSALEMLNAVIVPVFWTSDSKEARHHRSLQKQKKNAEARRQKRGRRKSSDVENLSRRKASSAMGGLSGVFHSTGLGSLIGVKSPIHESRFRSEDTRAKYLDHDYPLTAIITGVHQIGSHWQYEVTVRCAQTGETWTVSRRFSYFVNLYVFPLSLSFFFLLTLSVSHPTRP